MTPSQTFPIDSDFIVRTSGGFASPYGSYERHAVLEVDQGVTSVPVISAYARGARSIVRDYGPKPCDSTRDRCYRALELAACVELATALNTEQSEKRSE